MISDNDKNDITDTKNTKNNKMSGKHKGKDHSLFGSLVDISHFGEHFCRFGE